MRLHHVQVPTPGLEALAARLEEHGCAVDRSQRPNAAGFVRFHVFDPFGNRVEVVHAVTEE